MVRSGVEGAKSYSRDEYVEPGEFVYLLRYLRDYFELHIMFSRLEFERDQGGSTIIGKKEIKKAEQ